MKLLTRVITSVVICPLALTSLSACEAQKIDGSIFRDANGNVVPPDNSSPIPNLDCEIPSSAKLGPPIPLTIVVHDDTDIPMRFQITGQATQFGITLYRFGHEVRKTKLGLDTLPDEHKHPGGFPEGSGSFASDLVPAHGTLKFQADLSKLFDVSLAGKYSVVIHRRMYLRSVLTDLVVANQFEVKN